jgi:hypothetical protein
VHSVDGERFDGGVDFEMADRWRHLGWRAHTDEEELTWAG